MGTSRQPSRFIIVDLPEPEGPMMATYSPFRIRRSTPSSALTTLSPVRYSFLTPSTQIISLITRIQGIDGPAAFLSQVEGEGTHEHVDVFSLDLCRQLAGVRGDIIT